MTKVASLVAFTAAISVACTSSKPNPASDSATAANVKASVESTTAAFHDALRTNDTTAFFSHVDPDVKMIPPGEAPVKGIDALHTWYHAFLGQYTTSSLKLSEKEVFVEGDWATEVGTYEWGLKPVAGGADVVDRGHYMQVWKKQADGTWKFYREIWNSEIPAGTGT